ncbi:MAG: DUF2029 domain-containing protein [Acidobacteria bacterium]|nr:DUF2029 domain-containing protein [Acidobacteriota bacterium]
MNSSDPNSYSVAMLKQVIGLVSVGILQEIIWIAMCSLGPLRENTGSFLVLIFIQLALCLGTFFLLPVKGRYGIGIVLAFALLYRVTLVAAPPHQSEDVYRYIWDAKVASHGISPYGYPPDAPEIRHLRDAQVYPMINSKPYITAYPPSSQLVFRLSYSLFGADVTAMKAFFSLFEFLAVIVAWRLLVLWGKSCQPLLLMAWHPFFVFEFSASGHSDSMMILLLLLSIYLLVRGKESLSLVAYAGAVMAKLHPALWFPLILRRTGWKAALAGFATGLMLVLLYFTPASWINYIKSLTLYFRLFEFNAGIHYFIRFIGRWGFEESWDKLIGPYLGVVLLLICIGIWYRFPVRNERDLLHGGFWLMTADLCLATTVHPWYLSWAALALPFFPYAFMVYWTGACFLSYLAYSQHPVYEPAWVLLVQYIPMYALMIWEIRRRRPLLDIWPERRKPGEEKESLSRNAA